MLLPSERVSIDSCFIGELAARIDCDEQLLEEAVEHTRAAAASTEHVQREARHTTDRLLPKPLLLLLRQQEAKRDQQQMERLIVAKTTAASSSSIISSLSGAAAPATPVRKRTF